MNLLFAIDSLTLGGAQTFLLRLARALAPDHKIVIYVIVPTERDRQLEKSFLGGLNVEVFHATTPRITKLQSRLIGKVGNILYRFGYRTFRKDTTNWITGRQLRNIIKAEKIDCVNSHLFSSDWRVFQSIGQTNINWIISLHGCYETFLHGGYGENFRPDFLDNNFIEKAREVYSRANAVVLASDKNKEIDQYLPAELLSRVRREKIYYGFEPNEFIPKEREEFDIPSDSLIFGMIARGIEEKGWRALLEAFSALSAEGYRIHLVLVCDLTDHIQALAAEYQQSNILFAGPSYNPLEWVSMLDVALLPTYFSGESLPNSVIEYLYAGKPVIATDTGDISIMISYNEEKAGILIPFTTAHRPHPVALLAAMRDYISTPELIKEHGRIAKLAFQKFDMRACVRSYLNLFEKGTRT